MGFQRDIIPLAESRDSVSGRGRAEPCNAFKRSARGKSPNCPADCLEKGDALQERASPAIIAIVILL